MSNTIQTLRNIIRNSIDSTPHKVSAFFKTRVGDYAEHDKFIGITVPTLRKIAKDSIDMTLEELQHLIESPINEERLLSLIILTKQYIIATNKQQEAIYQFYITNIDHVNNWNLVDSSAHIIVGAHLFRHDYHILEELALSQNLWKRRIAIVATWYFIRKAELECTFKIATLLQNDSHDLIHKAVGWMLREAGKKDEKQLIAFLLENAHNMPKTMLRYAMERLSNEQRVAIRTSQQ